MRAGAHAERPSGCFRNPWNLFDRALADAWTLHEVRSFEEGELPRRLWRVTQTL